jgi:hypothetical protein
MIRDILDYQGKVIGQLELPDETSEEVWSAKLAVYAAAPFVPSMAEVVSKKLEEYQAKADKLIRSLLTENTLAGINAQQSDELFSEFSDVLIRLRNGAFPTALYRLSKKSPTGFATQEVINNWISKIREYL